VLDLDAVEPDRQRGIDEDPPALEVRLEAEERSEAQEDHPGRPRLRDARDQVVGGPRREPQVALEAAEQLRHARVREALPGLDERLDDRVRLSRNPYRTKPCAMSELSCGHTEPL